MRKKHGLKHQFLPTDQIGRHIRCIGKRGDASKRRNSPTGERSLPNRELRRGRVEGRGAREAHQVSQQPGPHERPDPRVSQGLPENAASRGRFQVERLGYEQDGGTRAAHDRHAAHLQAIDQDEGRKRGRSQGHTTAAGRRPDTNTRAQGTVQPGIGVPERVRSRVGSPRAQCRGA